MSGSSSDEVRMIPREEDVEVGDLWSSRPAGQRSTRGSGATRSSRGADDRREEVGGRRPRRTRRREMRRARRRRIAIVIGLVLVLIAVVVAAVVLPDLRGPLETLLGLRIDGVVEVTGRGWERMIDSVGG